MITRKQKKHVKGLTKKEGKPLLEAVDKEGSTAFFVEFGIKQFRRKVFILFRTNPSREFQPETVNIEDLVPQDHLLRKINETIDFSFIAEK
ncbi:MAG: hypothetical protein WBP80_05240, partial [Planifilum fulgidum]